MQQHQNNSNQKIYASMARISGNDKCPSENYGDSSKLTNWILDSGATCHMTQKFQILLQVNTKIRKNTLKLRTDITS